MTLSVCPYCRGPIDELVDQKVVCSGCGTPHHSDCYEENGGCTVFGCSSAPAEEPKLSIGAPELQTVGLSVNSAVATVPVPPPPPPPGVVVFRQVESPRLDPTNGLFAPSQYPHAVSEERIDLGFTPDENAKPRTTFIVLGVLLGAFGAHNFYAGYRKKAWAQLAITLLTLGFGSPMSWMWAVIDVCTITEDIHGVKFRN